MKELHVWRDGTAVGRFLEGADRTDAGRVDFEYSPAATCPVSLSLPLEGGWEKSAPGYFLEGLLPDSEAEREAMRDALHAASSGSFDLLAAADLTGGLCFSTHLLPQEAAGFRPESVSEEEIALRVRHLAAHQGSWQVGGGRNRFSLAGTQPKFPLARAGEHWTWSNIKNPSTHIVKPSSDGLPFIGVVEDAVMRLAAACGIPAARSSLMRFAGEEAYVVERFDRRVLPNGEVERAHVEDFTQSLGASRDDKYAVTAKDVLCLLRKVDETGRLGSRWVDQLIFNTLVGNCDAHAKNYSLFLEPERISLCPLYDSVCTLFWSEFSDTLAMPINGKRRTCDLSLSDWSAEAAMDGFDQHAMVEKVARIALSIVGNMDAVMASVPADVAEKLRGCILDNNRELLRELGVCSEAEVASLPSRKSVARYSVFPDGLADAVLLDSLVERQEIIDGMLRLHLNGGIVLRTGQRLPLSYIEVPQRAVLPSGLVGLPRSERLELFDARIELPCDEVYWGDLCDASRDYAEKQGVLHLDSDTEAGLKQTFANVVDEYPEMRSENAARAAGEQRG